MNKNDVTEYIKTLSNDLKALSINQDQDSNKLDNLIEKVEMIIKRTLSKNPLSVKHYIDELEEIKKFDPSLIMIDEKEILNKSWLSDIEKISNILDTARKEFELFG